MCETETLIYFQKIKELEDKISLLEKTIERIDYDFAKYKEEQEIRMAKILDDSASSDTHSSMPSLISIKNYEDEDEEDENENEEEEDEDEEDEEDEDEEDEDENEDENEDEYDDLTFKVFKATDDIIQEYLHQYLGI